ncbi:MAG: ABC transporter ATP-binding protein [Planctomycetes bacterium]|nr:ABC transporter ATP-binding protein [Planctomycetota bacterium]
MSSPFLVVRNVQKKFGATEALRGASFDVAAGELFGLLGPNGAGKTTLLTIIACLADATSGEVHFDGRLLTRHDRSIRREIGIGTQDLSVYGELTARENLKFFGKLYGLFGTDLNRRIDEVLEMAGLRDRANDRVSTFSGGMKRRLNLAVAVVHQPRLLLLDEPTTGVDPQSRNHIFERVRELNAAGMTVIYTSHYMEEVQTLCPRIGILDYGHLIACDTLPNLLRRIEGSIRVTVARDAPLVAERLGQEPGVRITSTNGNSIEIACADVSASLVRIVNGLRTLNIELIDLKSQQPSLEQVFLHLTEKSLRD